MRRRFFETELQANNESGVKMQLLDMMRSSETDFRTLKRVIEAEIPVTEALLGSVSKWFGNVEISYPIAEMEMDENARRSLALTVMQEMSDAVTKAVSALENGTDAEQVLADVSPVLDALWRELAGLYALVLNTAFERDTEGVNPEEVQQAVEAMLEGLAEMTGEDRESVLAELRQDPNFRAKLRRLGVDPDSL
jgi:hypothetical protein